MNMPDADYLASTMPEEERLQNLQALGVGLQTSLLFLMDRLSRYHELLELELEDAPGAESYLQQANASLAKATDLLRAFAALNPRDEADFESFDLVLLAHGMVSRLGRLDDIDVKLDLDGLDKQEAFIRGRLFLFQQLLFDLPRLLAAGGVAPSLQLRIDAERIDDAFFRTRKSALNGGEYYGIVISHAGRSPQRDETIALNERLVQAPSSHQLDRLLFAYGVIREHGGDLFTLKGDGPLDCLYVLLPAQRNQAAMYTESEVPDADDLHGDETILLVDDEAIIWDVVIDMLQGMGYTVVLAADGRDCVEIYQENPGQIDLVLLDMVMPEMNGKDAFFALREIDPNVKVLLQSGYIEEEDARDVLDAGARGFLRKPYRMRELARRIRAILNG